MIPASRPVRALGLAATVALAAALIGLERCGVRVQNPVLLFALAIVLAAFVGGVGDGLASAGLTLAFTSVYWSVPGRLFTYAPADAQRLAVQVVTTFAMAVMVGVLRRRADARAAALSEALERERDLAAALTGAMNEVKTLQGLVPICAYCKSVRDDAGYWQRIEAFLSARTDAAFTHGICPGCEAELEAKLDAGGG